ncbi:hypothetical protein BYT27DRAFT_7333407, partial [Phlegmacium glaucopus]
MSRLTIQDPNYAVYYFCIMKLDPDIGKLITPPSMGNSSSRLPTTMSTPANRPFPPRPQINPNNKMLCFGCFEEGHGVNRCATLGDLASNGVIMRNDVG